MTRTPDLREIAVTAARTAAAVPGVAHLTPRLADRLAERLRPPGTPATPGVRVLPQEAARLTTVEISLAVRAGHPATEVARRVRVAVIEALHADHPRVWATDVTVAVTVTAIV